MFDVDTINKRYFNIKIGSLNLEVEPPKIKTLKKITALTKVRDEEAINDLTAAVAMILNKNKSGRKIPDEVIEELDLDQLNEILTTYFEWLAGNKKDPN
jgi:hypothetical protein